MISFFVKVLHNLSLSPYIDKKGSFDLKYIYKFSQRMITYYVKILMAAYKICYYIVRFMTHLCT